jgi:hypothetical protein
MRLNLDTLVLAQVNTDNGLPVPGWVGTVVIIAAIVVAIFIATMFVRRGRGRG